jgi:hypothetical protein
MKNIGTVSPLVTSLAKPKFGSYFTARQKFRASAMGVALLVGAWGIAHFKGWDEFLNPTLPLATDAELNEENYPRFEDTEFPDRTAMMGTLINRLGVKALCTITTQSYGQVSVYADRPWNLGEGVDEREVASDADVLLTCARLIEEEFSHGRARSVTYELSVRNAWMSSSNAPGIGSFERNDENGNGIPYEPAPIRLGNKWHDNDAINRLEEAQQEFVSLQEVLRARDTTTSNLSDRVWQWAKDKAYSTVGWDTLSEQIQRRLREGVMGGKHEIHPS